MEKQDIITRNFGDKFLIFGHKKDEFYLLEKERKDTRRIISAFNPYDEERTIYITAMDMGPINSYDDETLINVLEELCSKEKLDMVFKAIRENDFSKLTFTEEEVLLKLFDYQEGDLVGSDTVKWDNGEIVKGLKKYTNI